MPEAVREAVSAALLLTRPEDADAVAPRLLATPGVEIVGRKGGRFALVLEAEDAGTLGDLLTRLNLLPLVLSASMIAHYDASEGPSA